MVKAKKKFGQNFLNDAFILNKIIESIPKNEAEILVEIGAGLGDLTQKLLMREKVISYEIDKDLSRLLKEKFKKDLEEKNLELIEQDVLEVWDKNLNQKKYNLVANLPYYVASKIILKALEDENCLSIIVMVQKEVAEKFSATCGEKNFSYLAIFTSIFAQSKILFDVEAKYFNPPPKVTSSVLKVDKFKNIDTKINLEGFKAYLKVAFMSPRKTLFVNLAKNYDKEKLKKIFLQENLELNLRPHQVNTKQHHRLFEFL